MPRIIANAETIRNEIERRIKASNELGGDCKDCGAPTPRLTNPTANEGCNWTVDVLPKMVPGCSDVVMNITRAVMAEYELIA